MATYNKIWLLILNADHTQMMVLEEWIHNDDHWLGTVYKVIGGTIHDNEDHIACLCREVKEEIGCEIAQDTLQLIGVYEADAAWQPGKTVSITLYSGTVLGEAKAQIDDEDIVDIVWIKPDLTLVQLQPNMILKEYILPDLLARNIIKSI